MGTNKVNQAERAFKAWQILTKLAATGRLITYEDLAKALEIHHRTIRFVLEMIQDYCLKNELPPLTILVVNKQTNEPGAGFIAWSHDNLLEGRTRVREKNWSQESNPYAFASDGTTDDALVRRLLTAPDEAGDVFAKVKVRGTQQMIFRRALLRAYGGRCAITGISFGQILDAAHIIPWATCNLDQKMDPRNGILMLCSYHRLFDLGLFSINENYRVAFTPFDVGELTEADHSFVAAVNGRKITLPKDKRLWPDTKLVNRRNSELAATPR